jgi:hypothetical protein
MMQNLGLGPDYPGDNAPLKEHQKRVGTWIGNELIPPGGSIPAKVKPLTQAELDQAERQASPDGLTKKERAYNK